MTVGDEQLVSRLGLCIQQRMMKPAWSLESDEVGEEEKVNEQTLLDEKVGRNLPHRP